MNAWIPYALVTGALAVSIAHAAQPNTLTPEEKAAGWQLLFDGRSLEGWRMSEERENTVPFRVQDSELLALGPRSHLYYLGPVQNHDFRNFELKLEVKTFPNANSGVYFHTSFLEGTWPSKGYEVQVNNSFDSDPSRTGGLWGIQDNKVVPVKDGEWFGLHVKVEGKRIVTKVNDKVIADYTEEANPKRSDELKNRLIDRGTFALQAHHTGSEVHYRNIKVRPLP